MKLFRDEEGKEVVYIQCKDISLITAVNSSLKSFNENELFSSLLISDRKGYVRLENPQTVEKLKGMHFIVDFDEFQDLDEEEIHEKFQENRFEMDRLQVQLRRIKKSKKKGLSEIYMTKNHYAEDILEYLEYRRKNKIPQYRNVTS